MPNWVYNTITVSGPYKYVLEVKQVMSQDIPTQRRKEGSAWEDEQGVWDMVETDFSFFNVVAPPRDKWGEYFTTSGSAYESTEYNWYGWNIKNWGCKWDAINNDFPILDGEFLSRDSDRNELVYRFDTAWSPPIEFVDAMAARFNMCQIELEYEEEQGWGGERVYDAGELFSNSEYDIPGSHQDYMDKGRDCNFCEWGEPAHDCPGYIPIEHVKPVELTAEILLARLKAEGEGDSK